MLRRLLLLAILLLAVWSPVTAADFFGRPETPPAATAEPGRTAPVALLTALPAPLRQALSASLALQSRWNARLREQLRLARENHSGRPALAIIGLSFLYGVFHAVGPGHGKMVVGSYFLTRRARLAHGLGMSLAAALTQALSAILLVGLLAALFDVSARQILDHAASLETVSYGALVLLGGWMAWGVLSGRRCHHDHGHDHEHEAPDHACGCAAHDPAETPPAAGKGLRDVLALGAVVGLRPCSGAILVLMFTLANGIFLIGVLSTLAMALGVAITVAAVSLAGLGLHRGLGRLGRRVQPAAQWAYGALAVAGALLIALFGALQLLALWSGLLTPMAG